MGQTNSFDARLNHCLRQLAAGEAGAREELLAVASERIRTMAHRMLRRFPGVRRWDDTDDVVQNASLRLYRAMGEIVPTDSRGLLGLAALQIRRELLDLARKHASPNSYAANHDSNAIGGGGDTRRMIVDGAADERLDAEALDRWTRFHEAVATLPEAEREVFGLVWYMGLEQQEIGTLVGCSIRTVKRRWDKGKSLVIAALGGAHPDTPLDDEQQGK